MASSPISGSLLYGKIVVIRRSGEDGSIFPLTMKTCVIGRAENCSIRVQLPTVSEQQCLIEVMDDSTVTVTDLSQSNPTKLNSKPLSSTTATLSHKDLVGVVDRYFRFEYPDGHPLAYDEIEVPKRRSLVTRKSKSPKRGEVITSDMKVVTPTRKPPLPVFSDDIENTEPELVTSPTAMSTEKLTRRRSSSSSFSVNKSKTKILTPQRKPPLPTSVTHVQSAEALPGSPVLPLRKSASLRKSLSELKQRTGSIIEASETAASPLPSSAGVKRSSPRQAVPSKKRRVSFGGYLSPELFDKSLPAGTPIKKGTIPQRLSVDSCVANGSPSRGLLKHRSVAVPKTSSIPEDSPNRRSPRITAGSSPAGFSSTPANNNSIKDSSNVKSDTSSTTSSSRRRSRHVVVKSPHIPHHEMSDQELMLYAAQRSEEGEVFKRRSHSPEGTLSPPLTPAHEKQISSASPVLVSKSSARKTVKTASPKTASPARSSPKVTLKTKSSPALSRSAPSPKSPLSRSTGKSKKLLTPKPARSVMTPGKSNIIHTDTPRPKTPNSSSQNIDSDENVEKIIAAPMDFKKAVALRAIHGKSATPVLSAQAKLQLTPAKDSRTTPKSKKNSSARKSTGKKLPVKQSWADVVKVNKKKLESGMKKSVANKKPKTTYTKKTAASKKTKTTAHPVKTPVKVNRKGFAQSTGHVDSPDTIVIQKRRIPKSKTPAKLQESIYEYLPPTPSPPTIMFVSPLAEEKTRKRKSPLTKAAIDNSSPNLKGVRELMSVPTTRKSISLKGVKEVLAEAKPRRSAKLVGVKELLKEPKSGHAVLSVGLKELMQEPKPSKEVSLIGVKELLGPKKSGKGAQLTGIKELMKSPKEVASPRLAGVKELFSQPKSNASPQLKGVKELVRLPKHRLSVDLIGVSELFTAESPPNKRRKANPPSKPSPQKAVKATTRPTRTTRSRSKSTAQIAPVAEETNDVSIDTPNKRQRRPRKNVHTDVQSASKLSDIEELKIEADTQQPKKRSSKPADEDVNEGQRKRKAPVKSTPKQPRSKRVLVKDNHTDGEPAKTTTRSGRAKTSPSIEPKTPKQTRTKRSKTITGSSSEPSTKSEGVSSDDSASTSTRSRRPKASTNDNKPVTPKRMKGRQSNKTSTANVSGVAEGEKSANLKQGKKSKTPSSTSKPTTPKKTRGREVRKEDSPTIKKRGAAKAEKQKPTQTKTTPVARRTRSKK